jgi:hypothetical protein
MKNCSVQILTLLAVLASASTGFSQTYYIDFGGGGGASTGNILNIPVANPPNVSDVQLIDYATGTLAPTTLTLSGFEFSGGDGPATSTYPATSLTGTYLSPAGMNLAGNINGAAGVNTGVITFNNLDLSKTYELTLMGNRNNATTRDTIFTIGSVSAFTNQSNGVISGAQNETTTIITGDNNSGQAARFVNINPGQDGTFTITLTGSNNRWYVNGANLTAVPEPTTTVLLASALVGLLGRRRGSRE